MGKSSRRPMLLSTSSPSSFLLHHAARAAHSTHHATKHATKASHQSQPEASQCMSVAVDVREAARRSRKWIFVLEDTAHGRSTKGRYARGPTALSAAEERKTSARHDRRGIICSDAEWRSLLSLRGLRSGAAATSAARSLSRAIASTPHRGRIPRKVNPKVESKACHEPTWRGRARWDRRPPFGAAGDGESEQCQSSAAARAGRSGRCTGRRTLSRVHGFSRLLKASHSTRRRTPSSSSRFAWALGTCELLTRAPPGSRAARPMSMTC